MLSQDQIAQTAVVGVCTYYLFVWLSFRRFRRLGTVVPLYDPPITCPAMLRHIWKERFDDRTFWAGLLSPVAKGLATPHSAGGTALIRATSNERKVETLPAEEEILLSELVRGHSRKGVSINMLSAKLRRKRWWL